MNLRTFVLFLAPIFVIAKPKIRIVGGQIARGGQFPYAAAIYVTRNGGTYFCGGSLISNQWILTAGQCVQGATSFRIQLRSNTLEGTDPNRLTLATSTFVLHPSYNFETLENDIGLIKLRLPIEFSEYVRAITLPTTFTADYTEVTAIGWGQTDDFNTGLSNGLSWVTLTTLSNDECQLTYGNQITNDMLCVAGHFNEGICNGDMGSALIQTVGGNAVHVGVASFRSNKGCETTDPSGYIRTIPYVEWIKNDRTASQSRIIGGNTAVAGQFPFSAAIYVYTKEGTYFCGGALISNEWILTAGQCVNGAVRFTIYLGSNNLEENEPSRVVVAAEEYILHPKYEPLTLWNDIGLIRLRLPITFTDYIKPINLPTAPVKTYALVVAVGWGQTSDSDSSIASTLNRVSLTVLSNTECQQTFGHQITDEMVCADGNYNEGTCKGDSGGPLIQYLHGTNANHVGISSFISDRGCESVDPSGFTRTYPYVDWIRNVTNIL